MHAATSAGRYVEVRELTVSYRESAVKAWRRQVRKESTMNPRLEALDDAFLARRCLRR